MNQHRVLTSAIDVISHFRARRFPLRNVTNDIIKARKLNSSERKVLFDAVFDFIRESFLFNQFVEQTVKFASSMSVQQKDTLLLKVLFPDTPEHKALHQSYQEWLRALGRERFLQALGPFISGQLKADYAQDAVLVAEGFFRKPKKYLAIDLRSVTLEQVCSALDLAQITYVLHPMLPRAIGIDTHLDLASLPQSIAQHVWFMDAGSQIIAELINPKPDETVLDLCTGEGNKARYITMKDCFYVAADVDESRLNIAKKRLRPKNTQFVVADGRRLPFPANHFDWILLDAPCSGVGTLARQPDLAYRLDMNSLKNYVKLQRELLDAASNLLKPGGRLIYATCSLFAVENEQQIKRIIAENNQVKPLRLSDLNSGDVKIAKAELNKNSFTIFPHINDCDGFYFTVLTK
jgi:16S rRNA C967 or C1407 C5-methylase (RsmB/RsmF family)